MLPDRTGPFDLSRAVPSTLLSRGRDSCRTSHGGHPLDLFALSVQALSIAFERILERPGYLYPLRNRGFQPVILIVLVVFLLFRRQGLFGEKVAEKA
jgi:hypothetical protein